jgi:hypothetical protein
LQAFVTHQPACFEELWRAGALPGLVVSVAKCTGRSSTARDIVTQAELLSGLLRPPAPGEQPWYAASSERQQFVLLVLARVGGAAAAEVLECTDNGAARIGTHDLAAPLIAALHTAVEQLGGQPLLRQHLQAAAPELLPRVDAVRDTLAGRSADFGGRVAIVASALELLVALGSELDPPALGLRLPGCHNPACTSLAGASEAGMALKRCKGCGVARWVRDGQLQGWRAFSPVAANLKFTPGAMCLTDHAWRPGMLCAGTAMPSAPSSTGSTTRPRAGQQPASRADLGQWAGCCSSVWSAPRKGVGGGASYPMLGALHSASS